MQSKNMASDQIDQNNNNRQSIELKQAIIDLNNDRFKPYYKLITNSSLICTFYLSLSMTVASIFIEKDIDSEATSNVRVSLTTLIGLAALIYSSAGIFYYNYRNYLLTLVQYLFVWLVNVILSVLSFIYTSWQSTEGKEFEAADLLS